MDTTYLDFISKGALIAQHTECCSQACGLLAMLFLIDWVQAEHLQHAAQQILFSTAVHAALQPVAEAPAALAEHVVGLLLLLLQQLIFQRFMLVLLLLLLALLLILHLIVELLTKLSQHRSLPLPLLLQAKLQCRLR